MSAWYPWFKAVHLIAMVAWFAGLFYIFRLFVYHVKHQDEPSVAATLTTMEDKLLRIIMMPAMLTTCLFGTLMIWTIPGFLRQGWLHVKLLCVVGLIAYHMFSIRVHKQFAQKEYTLSEKACRMINEAPTILLFVIVFMAVLKPF